MARVQNIVSLPAVATAGRPLAVGPGRGENTWPRNRSRSRDLPQSSDHGVYEVRRATNVPDQTVFTDNNEFDIKADVIEAGMNYRLPIVEDTARREAKFSPRDYKEPMQRSVRKTIERIRIGMNRTMNVTSSQKCKRMQTTSPRDYKECNDQSTRNERIR